MPWLKRPLAFWWKYPETTVISIRPLQELGKGTERARAVTQGTLDEVKGAMGLAPI